jgi:hypothetical protein
MCLAIVNEQGTHAVGKTIGCAAQSSDRIRVGNGIGWRGLLSSRFYSIFDE